MNNQIIIDGQDSKRNIASMIANLPCDGSKVVTIEDYSLDRNEAQNALMWHWSREVSKRTNNSINWVHGESKLLLLLPMMKGWGGKSLDQANFFETLREQLTGYEFEVYAAYGNIRTKDLSIKRMAEYLDGYYKHYTLNDVYLTRSIDLYYQAMGKELQR